MFPGVETGSLVAPDHDYPSRIDIDLTATDARGLAATGNGFACSHGRSTSGSAPIRRGSPSPPAP